PGGERRECRRRGRTCARGDEDPLAAVGLAAFPLGLRSCRMAVALVDEVARLAVPIRPDRRAVEHPATLAAPLCRRFAVAWPLCPMLRPPRPGGTMTRRTLR